MAINFERGANVFLIQNLLDIYLHQPIIHFFYWHSLTISCHYTATKASSAHLKTSTIISILKMPYEILTLHKVQNIMKLHKEGT